MHESPHAWIALRLPSRGEGQFSRKRSPPPSWTHKCTSFLCHAPQHCWERIYTPLLTRHIHITFMCHITCIQSLSEQLYTQKKQRPCMTTSLAHSILHSCTTCALVYIPGRCVYRVMYTRVQVHVYTTTHTYKGACIYDRACMCQSACIC